MSEVEPIYRLSGSLKINGENLNPFNFKNFNINYLCLYIGGVQVPSKPLQPDFKISNMYVDAYHTLFSGTGIHYLNGGNSISREAHANGCSFRFQCNTGFVSKSRHSLESSKTW